MFLEMDRRSESCKEFTCTVIKREKPMKVGEALQRVLSQAVCEDRLVSGIAEIATFLQSVPACSVMFCVLEANNDEDIRMKLLEAFCTEYKIKIIKVDSFQTICKKQFPIVRMKQTESEARAITVDDNSSAYLVLNKRTNLTSEEEFVLTFYETYRYCKNTYPVLKISGKKSVNT